ncbi:MAG: hypothetical protein U0929_17915 [Planctomycetaceae bacterium]
MKCPIHDKRIKPLIPGERCWCRSCALAAGKSEEGFYDPFFYPEEEDNGNDGAREIINVIGTNKWLTPSGTLVKLSRAGAVLTMENGEVWHIVESATGFDKPNQKSVWIVPDYRIEEYNRM